MSESAAVSRKESEKGYRYHAWRCLLAGSPEIKIISLYADDYLPVSAPATAVTFDDCTPEVIAVCYFYFVNPDRFSRSLR